MRVSLTTSLLALVLSAPSLAQDWIIPAGQLVTYDTRGGRRTVQSLTIEPGATLRIVGRDPFVLVATDSVVVRGTLDVSGFDAGGWVPLSGSFAPWPGPGRGVAGGGGGGGVDLLDTITLPFGMSGGAPRLAATGGGGGGESSMATGSNDNRRGSGGGGGVLAANAAVDPDPDSPLNEGRIAEAGRDGSPNGMGTLSQVQPAAGGLPGPLVFVDPLRQNDFWGTKVLGPGSELRGEIAFPVAGQGGGGGGHAINSASFNPPYPAYGLDVGGCGGGGGGLGFVLTNTFSIEAGGRVLANGGRGGGGQNTVFFDRVGGGGGGGSGGMLVLSAHRWRYSQ